MKKTKKKQKATKSKPVAQAQKGPQRDAEQPAEVNTTADFKAGRDL